MSHRSLVPHALAGVSFLFAWSCGSVPTAPTTMEAVAGVSDNAQQLSLTIPDTGVFTSETGLIKKIITCPEQTTLAADTQTCGSDTLALSNPGPTSMVTVHYTGWTTDGEEFDSSVTRGTPASFPLNQVIAGWTEGLQTMVVGEKARFWIPEDLAYQGLPGRPAGMLIFDVELLEISEASTSGRGMLDELDESVMDTMAGCLGMGQPAPEGPGLGLTTETALATLSGSWVLGLSDYQQTCARALGAALSGEDEEYLASIEEGALRDWLTTVSEQREGETGPETQAARYIHDMLESPPNIVLSITEEAFVISGDDDMTADLTLLSAEGDMVSLAVEMEGGTDNLDIHFVTSDQILVAPEGEPGDGTIFDRTTD